MEHATVTENHSTAQHTKGWRGEEQIGGLPGVPFFAHSFGTLSFPSPSSSRLCAARRGCAKKLHLFIVGLFLVNYRILNNGNPLYKPLCNSDMTYPNRCPVDCCGQV